MSSHVSIKQLFTTSNDARGTAYPNAYEHTAFNLPLRLYLFQLTFHTLREVDTLDEFLDLILCYLRNHAFFDPPVQHLDWHVPSDVRFDPTNCTRRVL